MTALFCSSKTPDLLFPSTVRLPAFHFFYERFFFPAALLSRAIFLLDSASYYQITSVIGFVTSATDSHLHNINFAIVFSFLHLSFCFCFQEAVFATDPHLQQKESSAVLAIAIAIADFSLRHRLFVVDRLLPSTAVLLLTSPSKPSSRPSWSNTASPGDHHLSLPAFQSSTSLLAASPDRQHPWRQRLPDHFTRSFFFFFSFFSTAALINPSLTGESSYRYLFHVLCQAVLHPTSNLFRRAVAVLLSASPSRPVLTSRSKIVSTDLKQQKRVLLLAILPTSLCLQAAVLQLPTSYSTTRVVLGAASLPRPGLTITPYILQSFKEDGLLSCREPSGSYL